MLDPSPGLRLGEAALDALTCAELLISSRDERLLQLAQERSCWNDHRGDMCEVYHGGTLRCYVHIMDQGLCYRVNTLAAYMEANRLVSLGRVRGQSRGCQGSRPGLPGRRLLPHLHGV